MKNDIRLLSLLSLEKSRRCMKRPTDFAGKIRQSPIVHLRKFTSYFVSYENFRIANICGSCGKKAMALAALGAEVTVFDLSEDNQK